MKFRNTLGLAVPAVFLLSSATSAIAVEASASAKAKAQTLVKEAIAFAKKNGKDALLKEASQAQGRFHVKEGNDQYIFIYDGTGTCMGMGYQANLVGVNRWTLKDADGRLIIQELISTAKTKGSGWVDYRYLNPKTGKVEPKTSYVEKMDDWTVGCGVYKQ